MKKDIFIGMFVGLIANAMGLFLAANFLGNGDDFTVVIQAAAKEEFLGKLISLGAVLNLIAWRSIRRFTWLKFDKSIETHRLQCRY